MPNDTQANARKLECCHADTCLPDYWGGHHLPHIQIPVYRGMTHKSLIAELHSELSNGCVMGSDPVTRDDSGPAGDAWYKRAHAAINRIEFNTRGRLFNDLEPDSDDCEESVYAFFVFKEA